MITARPTTDSGTGEGPQDRDAGTRIVAIINELLREVQGGAQAVTVSLDSRLGPDVGLDSLARVELMLRVQREFGVELPDSTLNVRSPRELVADVLAAAPGDVPLAAGQTERVAAIADGGEPATAETLVDVLSWHVGQHGDYAQTSLLGSARVAPISYDYLYSKGLRVAGGLQALGIAAGDTVAIMLPTGVDYLVSFFGIVLVGAAPVPIYPPARIEQAADHVRRHAGIIHNAGAKVLITTAQMAPLARGLESTGARLTVARPERLLGFEPGEPCQPAADELALLQYTSGSTGQPKGVALSHANLLSNIRVLGKRMEVDSSDCFVSWLPLYHDMGLIGAWLGTLYFGCRLVLMSPQRFLMDPSRWLVALSEYGGTLSASPNFGYELCLKRVRDEDIAGIDLSHWRHAMNGAEPVRAETIRRFRERFAAYGLAPSAVKAVYGLAESSVGLTVPDPDSPSRIDRVERAAIQRDGRIVAAGPDAADALEYVACGRPIDGHEVRIVDVTGHELPERREGLIEFRGPSATRGYYRNPEATAELFDGSWLRTGDRGYLHGGELYITGRIKDVIIRGGRNIHPTELDDVVGAVDGIRKGCVATFGNTLADGGEEIVVVAETTISAPDERERLSTRVRESLLAQAEVAPDRIVLVPPHTVLKTSSGKIRRADTRELYRRQRLGSGRLARYRQQAVLWRWAIAERLSRWRRAARVYAYSGYAWVVLGVAGTLTWLLVATLPGLSTRWRVVRAGAGLFLRLTGLRVTVTGTPRLAEHDTFAVASNHSSYLDGLVLASAVPQPLRFVAKAELADQFVAGTFLKRLRTLFVDRDAPDQADALARDLEAALLAGDRLAVFPEGTFFRRPELLPLRMGVFVAAARASRPIVPVAIDGTRNILRSESWLLSRAPVTVTIGEPLTAASPDWHGAVGLKDRTGEAIASMLDAGRDER